MAMNLKDNGREPKSCLGQVFHFKVDSFSVMKELQGVTL
jgi:hypothetical protein